MAYFKKANSLSLRLSTLLGTGLLLGSAAFAQEGGLLGTYVECFAKGNGDVPYPMIMLHSNVGQGGAYGPGDHAWYFKIDQTSPHGFSLENKNIYNGSSSTYKLLNFTTNGLTGIGSNSTPVQTLDVSGAIKIGAHVSSISITPPDGSIQYINGQFQGYANNKWNTFNASSSPWTKSGSNVYPINYTTDIVGIGTPDPLSKLHVADGAIRVSNSGSPVSDNGLALGDGGTYTWLQSKASVPLAINPVSNDYVAIGFVPGTTGYNVGGHKLAVNGSIVCTELKVKNTIAWPDYVFSNDYQLKSLPETEAFIKKHHHLPEVPSAETISKEGLEVGQMNAILLKKIEELTLHVIRLEKELNRVSNQSGK